MAKKKTQGWLDAYDDELQLGGYVYPVNYVPQAENGIEGTMGGLTDQGFDYNGAWGGPSAQNGLTFLEPTSRKLPMGHVIPKSDPSTELAISVGGEDGEPAYLIPSFKYGKYLIDKDAKAEFRKTGEHLGGPFKTWQEADEWERTVRHPYVEKGQNIPTPFRRWGKDFAMGGSLPGSVGFTYARTKGIPSNGPYAKKTMASAQDGEEVEYKELPEIVVVGGKDKPTIDLYKKELDKLQSSESNPYSGSTEFANYYAKMQMAKKFGVPKIRPKEPVGIIGSFFRNRSGIKSDPNEPWSQYNPNNKTAFVDFDNYTSSYIPELSHYVSQTKKGDGYTNANIKNAWEYIKGNDPYEVKGTEEYIAHKEIEPAIKEAYNQFREEGRKKFTEAAYNSIRRNLYEKDKKLLTLVDNLQNGGEMKFYQEGLDWTPKNISKDGSEIPKAQPGKKITFEDLVKSTKKRAASDNTNSGIKSKVKNQIGAQEASNQKAEQKVQTLVDKGGYSEAHARRAVKNKEEKANSILEKVSNDDYRIQMHPDFDPNKSTDEQSYLLNDNSLRTRLLRGSNMLMNAGNPVGDFAAGMITAPARSFANLTMDANNRYFNPNNTGAGNSANFAEDVINIFPSIIPGAAGALGQVSNAVSKGTRAAGKYITNKSKMIDEAIDYAIEAVDRKYITPIQFRKQIADIKKEHALAAERYNSPEVAERMKHVLGINPKDIDQPMLTFNTGEGSYYSSRANAINMDLRQINRLSKNAFTTSPKSVYEHEYGHFLQRESHRQSEDFANDLIKYEEDLLKYNDPENQKRLADPNTWLSNQKQGVVFNPGFRPEPYSRPTKIDMYANNVYGVDPLTGEFGYEPKHVRSYDNADYFTHRNLEQTAHLREMRQNMLEQGYLKNLYDPISEETITKFIKENPKDRIASFTGVSEINRIKGLEKIFRNLPAVIPAVGIGVAATADKKKKGGKVKKDDNGYWNPDNWGEPVEIGSNEITMEGVYEPLLGISDTGDTQMMYPGEDYKFKGKKVTEYPVAQNGKLQPLVDEQLEYIQSPLYKQRLTNMNVKDADQIAKLRADYLKKLKIEVKDRSPIGGVSNQTTSVYENGVERPVVTLMRGDYDEGIAAHEIGHVTTAPYSGTKVTSPYNASYNQLSPAESWMFYNRNKTLKPQLDYVYNQYTQTHVPESMIRYYDSDIVGSRLSAKDSSQVGYKPDIHDVSATEAYGDLSAIRHFLKKSGVTKSYGERLTPDMWKKAMENKKLSNEEHFKRMRKNYNDDAIIQLNNIIAQNKSSIGEDTAKNGGWLEKYK